MSEPKASSIGKRGKQRLSATDRESLVRYAIRIRSVSPDSYQFATRIMDKSVDVCGWRIPRRIAQGIIKSANVRLSAEISDAQPFFPSQVVYDLQEAFAIAREALAEASVKRTKDGKIDQQSGKRDASFHRCLSSVTDLLRLRQELASLMPAEQESDGVPDVIEFVEKSPPAVDEQPQEQDGHGET